MQQFKQKNCCFVSDDEALIDQKPLTFDLWPDCVSVELIELILLNDCTAVCPLTCDFTSCFYSPNCCVCYQVNNAVSELFSGDLNRRLVFLLQWPGCIGPRREDGVAGSRWWTCPGAAGVPVDSSWAAALCPRCRLWWAAASAMGRGSGAGEALLLLGFFWLMFFTMKWSLIRLSNFAGVPLRQCKY